MHYFCVTNWNSISHDVRARGWGNWCSRPFYLTPRETPLHPQRTQLSRRINVDYSRCDLLMDRKITFIQMVCFAMTAADRGLSWVCAVGNLRGTIKLWNNPDHRDWIYFWYQTGVPCAFSLRTFQFFKMMDTVWFRQFVPTIIESLFSSHWINLNILKKHLVQAKWRNIQ